MPKSNPRAIVLIIEPMTTAPHNRLEFTLQRVAGEQEARRLQKESGKDPALWGFYGYHVENGKTKWRCNGRAIGLPALS